MPNVLKLTAENSAELLNTGAYDAGALMRLQSATVSAGPFADVSGTGSTPTTALVAGTRIYTGYDPAGTSTTWYRTRFENSGGTRVSDWSTVFQVSAQGSGLLASLYDLKQWLDRNASTDTADDEALLELLIQCGDYVSLYCERTFAPDPVTVYTFDGFSALRGDRVLPVRRGIRSVTTLEVATNTGGTLTAANAADVFLRPTDGERALGWPPTEIWLSDIPVGSVTYFYPGFANVRVTGAFGFAAVPRDIELIVLTMAGKRWLSRQAGQTDIVGTGESGQPIVRPALSRPDMETLNWYRGEWVA